MRRTNELKSIKYLPEYEEVYKLIYNADLDYIVDFSAKETDNEDYKKYNGLRISIKSQKLNYSIAICQIFNNYMIEVTPKIKKSFKNYDYERLDFYSFKSLSLLVEKLEKLIKPCL